MRGKDEQEKYRQAVIERERARLLAEYASDLQDHLPKGVLRNPADFEVVYGRPPAFDEDKEERDMIAQRNTGIPVPVRGAPQERADSRNNQGNATQGRRAGDGNRTPMSQSRPQSERGSPRNRGYGGGSPMNSMNGNGMSRPQSQSNYFNERGQGSPQNRNGNAYGNQQNQQNRSRPGSQQSRMGSYDNQEGPHDRPF